MAPTVGRGWIDLAHGIFYRRPAGKLETKKRAPPIPLPPRLLAHIRRWKRKGLAAEYVVEYAGKPVLRVSKAFRHAARDAGLIGVTPHVLRHTAASWMMQEGCDVLVAAAYLGMTPQILLGVYGHHHPGHLSQAVAAVSGDNARALRRSPHTPRTHSAHTMDATKRERTRTNVVKLA
jgi:integrase